MRSNGEDRVNRRRFLRQSGVAAAAVLTAGRLVEAAPAGATVAVVRDKTKKSVKGFQVDAEIVQRLVDQAVMTLSGKDDLVKAWATYVRPKDRVAIKFNGLFFRATTHGEVIHAVTKGLVKAGVDPANIVVYDRSDGDMKTSRLTINREGKGVRIYGTGRSYGKKVKAGKVGTKLSDILTRADVLINLPMMKSHVRCGVTGALKNHLGSVPNAGAFHENCCVAIADLNTLGPIKDKTRLCIADALYSLYDAGPGYGGRARWDYHGILASTDPVALDATMADIVLAKRREKGMKKLVNAPLHIARAAELGLGVADLGRIKRLAVEI